MIESIQRRVVKLIAQIVGKPENKIPSDAHLIEDIGFDSPDLAELSQLLQADFGIALPQACQPGYLTVRSLANHVEAMLRVRRAA